MTVSPSGPFGNQPKYRVGTGESGESKAKSTTFLSLYLEPSVALRMEAISRDSLRR